MVVPAVVVSPIVAVLEQADLPMLESGDCAGTAGVALSLVEAFERVPDPRRARGIRHGLVPLLVVAACAVLTGARSFAAIGEYARDKGRLVLDTLGVDGAVAHPATIRRILVDLDPGGLQKAITAWSVGRAAAGDRPPAGTPVRELRRVIAVDGKTVRGAADAEGRQPHLVAALDQRTDRSRSSPIPSIMAPERSPAQPIRCPATRPTVPAVQSTGEGACRAFLVRVRDLDGGVQADHDGLPEVDIGDPRRRDRTEPVADQRPHAAAGP